jgi:proteasome accessory factor C
VTENPYGRLGRRLQRILVMLPYAIHHPGVSVDELATRFNVKKRDLVDDLNLVFVCGLPGYGPGDLIDVRLEEDRVYVEMADYFAAPLRLTPAEALVLYAGGSAIASLPGMEEADALRRALTKVRRALGRGEEGDGAAVQVRLEQAAGGHLEALQNALRDAVQVDIEYFSASRGELTERSVEPWGLIAALGRWYLVGLDHLSGEERMFRVDRIKSVAVLDAAAPVPPDFDPGRYRGAFSGRDGDLRVTLEISASAAQWFEDYYPVESGETLDDGWRRVVLVAGGERWAATLVVRLGRDVRSIAPASVMDASRALAERIARAHAD